MALFLRWTDLEDAVNRLLYSEKEESAHWKGPRVKAQEAGPVR